MRYLGQLKFILLSEYLNTVASLECYIYRRSQKFKCRKNHLGLFHFTDAYKCQDKLLLLHCAHLTASFPGQPG